MSSAQHRHDARRLPLSFVALAPLYMSVRVYMANRMPITDCDEVYNYWEPLHFILYGTGLQTWEYATEYGLRTYAYLLPLKVHVEYVLEPLLQVLDDATSSRLWSFLLSSGRPVPNSRLATFFLVRATLAALCAAAELFFLSALWKRQPSTFMSGSRSWFWMMLISLTASGMNHAAGAYLPSTTFLAVWMTCFALYLRGRHYWFIVVAVTATLSIGWPFGVVGLVPCGVSILIQAFRNGGARELMQALGFASFVSVAVQAIVFAIDNEHYGIWISPTLNIFAYNAAGDGDELYGEEPVSYYVKNLLLNLNVVAPLGLIGLPLLLLKSMWKRKVIDGDLQVMLSSMYLWLAITVPRPHKEERFLFPVYPLLVLGAIVSLNILLSTILSLLVRGTDDKTVSNRSRVGRFLQALIWIPVLVLSLGRTEALRRYYSAPLHVYAALATQPPPVQPAKVCVCGEWYRYPSSFYLPDNLSLGFLPSSFTGQLPQPFSKHGSRPESKAALQPFNDRNKHEPDRYETDTSNCRYIVDLEDGECASLVGRIHALESVPFLDAERTATLHRTLYIPYLHQQAIANGKVRFQEYVLYEVVD